jgi:DNA repair protein RadA/Sms
MGIDPPRTVKFKTKVTKNLWVCSECGYESSGFLGRCNSCGAWGSFKEFKINKSPGANNNPKHALFVNPESKVISLDEIPDDEEQRLGTGSSEFDSVLGGGIVCGSLVLIGGQPGIGKSTLLLQTAVFLAASPQTQSKILYISAEESSQQLKLRANRLRLASSVDLSQNLSEQARGNEVYSNINKHAEGERNVAISDFGTSLVNNLLIYPENNLEKIIKTIEELKPKLVIIDSIQAIFLPELNSVPGSVTQIRESCGNLMRLAKSTGTAILIVGHINKEGDLAGPKILEHMVDTVLQFEGESEQNLRVLRSIKNRFGSTDMVGLFNMSAEGLADLSNPSEIFLRQRSGGIVTATKEGRRSLLLEIQSLVLFSNLYNPRRLANGVDFNRLHQILAILEKKLDLSLSKADVYINVVGGLYIKEPAADLAIALSIYLSANNSEKIQEISKDFIALGEIGLTGEIRAVNNLESRLREAAKLGFRFALVPKSNFDHQPKFQLDQINMKIIPVSDINEAVRQISSGKLPKTL